MPFALALTVVLALLALFQLGLAVGAPWGHLAWGGAHRVLPARLRVGSVIAIVIYAAIALIAFGRLGAVQIMPQGVAEVAMWVVLGYFCLGVVMNAVSRSRLERWTMTPIAFVLALLSLFIALGWGALALPA